MQIENLRVMRVKHRQCVSTNDSFTVGQNESALLNVMASKYEVNYK